jgi:hypothetical protein
MSTADALRNIGLRAGRRLQGVHKPLVRLMRRRARAAEQRGFAEQVASTEAEIVSIGRSTGHIVVGPWLAEVGYEVLYWIPFLRWFQDAYAIAPERLVVVSRGGIEAAYGELAGTYVDLFDLMSPADLAGRNAQRRSSEEGGGQKQSSAGALDRDLLDLVAGRLGSRIDAICHPSLMFRLFRDVWHGNLPMDLLRTHTRYRRQSPTGQAPFADLPHDYIAAKLYAGPALSAADETRRAVRQVVEAAARVAPVVVLDTDLGIDEHRDFDLRDIPDVIALGARLDARTNLGVQIATIARSRCFLGTCGGLAWLAPLCGVPTVALLDSDRHLGPHLATMRHARHVTDAAAFSTLDVTALARLGVTAAESFDRRVGHSRGTGD